MFPIQEQGDGKGIGHSLDSFRKRFDEICEEHLATGRAATFAFIFYDLTDGSLKRILKDDGVFTKLDRLSGNRLSLFYLHNPSSRESVELFNQEFQDRLGISSSGPCVVFFRVGSEGVTDISVRAISSTNVMHGFHEIYEIVADYLAEDAIAKPPSKTWLSFGAGAKWIGKEAMASVVKEAIEKGKVFEHLEKLLKLQ